MDAPVLPPSQDNIPAIVTSATEPAQPPFIPALLSPASVWQTVHSTQVSAHSPQSSLPAPTATSLTLDKISTSASFWAWPRLARSFNFVERTLRAAQIDSAKRDQNGVAVLVERSQPDTWQSSTAAAEIRVKRVDLTPEQIAAENATWAEDFREKCLAYDSDGPSAGPLYQISLREHTLGYVAGEGRAYLLAEQLKRLLRQDSFEPEAIAPSPTEPYTDPDNSASPSLVVSADDRELFAINPSMTASTGHGPEWAAISWANNLRVALAVEPLSPTEAQLALKGLRASEASLSGEASWYGPYFHGRTTANGETFNQNDLTVAHKSLPFGTQLQVRNLINDQTVIVRVNDRGPYVGDRSLDLSKAAARCLGSEQVGVIPYEAVILKEAQPLAVAAES